MRGLRFTTVSLCALLLGSQAVVAQSPEPVPSPTEPPWAEPVPNAGRPLTHEELLAYRGELALEDDVWTTVVADTRIRRLPGPRRAAAGLRALEGVGTLPRGETHPGEPTVLATDALADRYPRGRSITGLSALYFTTDGMTLRGAVETPADTYLTPIEADAITRASGLPEGALIVVRGVLSRLIPETPCPELPRELNPRRFGGGSPFSTCPVGWLTSDPVTETRAGDPLTPARFGMRVQHGALEYFWRRVGQRQPEEATYLLRHVANPVDGGRPAMGWEVIGRVDPVDIPDPPDPLARAVGPTGLDWQPVLERQPPSDTSGVYGSRDAIITTAWAGGVASVHQGRDRVLSVWVSRDGVEWRGASLPTDIWHVDALLPLRGELALVANSVNSDEGNGRWEFDVWTSGDGLEWQQVTRHAVRTPKRFAAPYYRIVQGFWSTGDRLVAHETYTTYRCCGDSDGTAFVSAPRDDEPVTYAWASRDGGSWKRERVRGLNLADGWHYRDSVYEADDGLYALAGHPTYSIDRSQDGVRWRTIGRQPTGLDFYQARIFERTDDGFVIGGTVEEPRAVGEEWLESTVLWHSTDADRWRETYRPPVGQTISIASVGTTVAVAGGSLYPEPEGGVSWLMASVDGGRTWHEELDWSAEGSWCLRGLTASGTGILHDVACPPLDTASKYLFTVDLPPEPEPTPPPVTTVRSARQAVQCDVGTATHSKGLGVGGSDDPREAMQRMVRSGVVVPVAGYRELERDHGAVLYGFRNGGEVKVAVRVRRDGERWRPDGVSRCQLAEYGPEAKMGPGVRLWADADGRTIQDRSFRETCGWPSVHVIYLTEPGAPENQRNTRAFVRDPEGDARDQWQARYLKRAQLPSDAEFSGYRRAGAWLWLAADGSAAYVVKGDHVEQWPRVPTGIGCA